MKPKTNHNFSVQEKCPRLLLLKYLATAQFTEAEILLSNHPALRSILLHFPGLRHTAFFKRRIRFYRDYARTHGMTADLSADERLELRNQFAASHCKTRAVTEAAKKRISDFDLAATAGQIYRLRIKKLLRRRRKDRGLFM